MAITKHEGGISITGSDDIALYRMMAMESAMKFEIACPGMKATRGRSVFARAREEFGIKARSKWDVLTAFRNGPLAAAKLARIERAQSETVSAEG